MLHAIHLSDTHLGPTPDFRVREAQPAARLGRLVEAIGSLDFTPDFLVHTGDLANDPDPDAYRLAGEILAPLGIPLYCANGNHDDAAMLDEGITMGSRQPLGEATGRLAYTFDFPDLRGFVLDAKVPEAEGPHGELPQAQLDALEAALAEVDRPYAVFLHFPPFPIHSQWIDAYLPLKNGEALHEVLLQHADTGLNRGVFFGHLHRDLQLYRDGILYSGVGSPACEFSVGVHDEIVSFDADCPAVFHHLTFSETGTVVKSLTAKD